jgi:hypothetical protein
MMKQITLDWDTYQQELRTAHEKGVAHGVWTASKFVDQGEIFWIPEYVGWEKENLQEAVARKLVTQ